MTRFVAVNAMLRLMLVIAVTSGGKCLRCAGQEAQEVTDATQESDERPNIVVIIADDLGYGETGMMGNPEIPTPHIDALAESGVRCTAGYVTSSYCSASRAGLITGRYQSRFGYEMNPTGKKNLLPQAGLPTTETTFVKQLSEAGYATGLFGKWHLGTVDGKRPLDRGFDEFYGFLHEGHYYVNGPPYKGVLTMIRDKSMPEGELSREGNLIRGNYAPISEPDYDGDNNMLRGDREIIEADYLTDAITDEATQFIDDHSDEPFCMIAAYNAVHSPMQAKLEDVEMLRRIKDDQRRIFAGMLYALDRGVGRIRQQLAASGLTENTLVVFVSDNGGPTAELTSSNAPLRGGKGTLYEGGVRVPMVWSFPAQLPAGRSEDRPVLSLDIAATALDAAGLPVSESIDGVSLLDWVNDPTSDSPHTEIFWRMSGGKVALRDGNWKIVRPRGNAPIELYHLAGDLSETRNLVDEQPSKMRQLVNRLYAWEAEMPEPIRLK